MPKHDNFRINIFFVIVLIASSLILYRLFILSYVRHSVYSQTAAAQRDNITNILARGNIYLEDPTSSSLFLAATNKKFPLAYVVPSKVDWGSDGVKLAQVAGILKINQDLISNAIQSGQNSTKVLLRRLNDNQAGQIKNLNFKGLGVSYETDRFYPGQKLASNVIGFLGYDLNGRSGQYGIESYYNAELSGNAAPLNSESPGRHNIIDTLKNYFKSGSLTDSSLTPEPADIVLTIDRNIQAFVENELDATLEKWHASGGEAIVQDPQTGKILAMATSPTFDPNNYSASPAGTYLDGNVEQVFEPGSSFKPITMSAGIDLGKVTPATTYTDPGVINIGGYQIHNFDMKDHGTIDMTTVLEKSLNTGAAFVENLLGQDNFRNYVVNFGFGQKTGVDLPGEVGGDIANLYSGRQINFVTASFGQGIAVTPLQLVTAYSAIANGGRLMKPYIVDHISYANGSTATTQPEVASIPLKQQTSALLQTMLINVVDKGFDKARITGYDVAGKTGTAQIPAAGGGYEQGTFIHDFLGFAPAYNPKFVVLIKMDRPHGITFAADSLSPTFREIAQFLINYYKIPPTRK